MNTRITGIWPLGLASLVALIAMLVLGFFSMVERTQFLGIADSKEIVINSESPVEIEKVYVLEGQSVDQGQLLVQLKNPELTLKINQISHQLDQYRAQNDVDKNELQSALTRLEAEKKALIDETNYQIQELKNEYDLNMTLASRLQSISAKSLINNTNKADHPTLQRIERLKLELASAIQVYDVRIELQTKAIAEADKPVSIQINKLEKELSMLGAENEKLAKYAPISGMIGSVNYKAGEKVSPFAPVMTLHTKTPSIVKGYLREDEFSKVRVDDQLTIQSTADTQNQVRGTVVGVGARIVEYPIRLQKHQGMKGWGREITIRIPENNNLILGEKVLVTLNAGVNSPWHRFQAYVLPTETIAAIVPQKKRDKSKILEEPISIVRPILTINESSLEASAILYLPEMKQFLVASDDTPNDRFMLYLMDQSGKITGEITIPGIDEIDDIESMTRDDDGTIYIATSMSAKKNHSTPTSRRLLVAIKQNEDKSFYLYKSIPLADILARCARENPDVPWAGFILNALEKNALDMEGMFWHSNAFYLGFKSPLYMKRSIIIKILNADRLMEQQQIDGDQVAIWQMLNLISDQENIRERISDLLYVDGTLFITGVVDAGNRHQYTGSLWRFFIDEGNLQRITKFKDLKPEGITVTNKTSDLMVCFDQGEKRQSHIARIKDIR